MKKKIKIKQTKANIFYLIIGRLTAFILLSALSLQISIQLFIYIVENYATTLK